MHSENQNIYRGDVCHAAFCAQNARATLNFKHPTDNHRAHNRTDADLNSSHEKEGRVSLTVISLSSNCYKKIHIYVCDVMVMLCVSERHYLYINTSSSTIHEF